MKYLAVCPYCEYKIPRTWYFHWLPHMKKECSACQRKIKVNSLWEWGGNFILGIAWSIPVVLQLGGFIHWMVALTLVVTAFVVGYILFPYVTPFERED
jgi:uncharacterized heparinase superfamily protein